MLDHLSIPCNDIKAASAFYDAALKPLGYTRLMDFGDAMGYGAAQKPAFWLGAGKATPGKGLHICFAAQSRAAVDAFYAAAIGAGGRDNGTPGLRPHYHANYYGAFVFDLDGYAIEAVCHKPE